MTDQEQIEEVLHRAAVPIAIEIDNMLSRLPADADPIEVVRLNQANELRPAQGYRSREADILGTTASLGLDGVSRLDHLHGARRGTPALTFCYHL